MSTVDITKFFPSFSELEGEYYLITDDADDPGPGQIVLKEFEPKVMRIKSGKGEPIRISLRMQFSNEKWTLVLSWAASIYSCHKLDHQIKDNTISFNGEINYKGQKNPGTFRFVLAEDKKSTKVQFVAGFGPINGVEWNYQNEEPEWEEFDEYDD